MIRLKAIGEIITPWETPQNMPIQPIGAKGIEGKIILDKKYEEGLADLDGFSHITLLYFFNRQTNYELKAKPFMDKHERGVFSIRSPKRPNFIGLSTVELIGINGCELTIKDVDMLNHTPLLDIKPFFEDIDNRFNTRKGWLGEDADNFTDFKSDDRFTK